MKSYERSLEERGYTCLMAIGFGQRVDGTYSIKLAGSPVLRNLDQATWDAMYQTITQALARFRSTPLDDLEVE